MVSAIGGGIDEGFVLLPARLRAAGYHTHHTGKWCNFVMKMMDFTLKMIESILKTMDMECEQGTTELWAHCSCSIQITITIPGTTGFTGMVTERLLVKFRGKLLATASTAALSAAF